MREKNVRPKDDFPGTPRWVKVSGIIAIVVILIAVAVMFLGGGHHGPGRHVPSKDVQQTQ